MKKTMFDILDNTPEGIDEETITPAYDIKPENVIKGVHKKLESENGRTENSGSVKTEKQTVKRKSRKLPIILAAAAAAAVAAGTISVGAAGGINSIIGEHSAGKIVNNLYPGSNVKVSAAKGYLGKFVGISGDNTNMASLLTISNSDGSDIIESGKTAFIETNNYCNYYDKTCKAYEEEVIDVFSTTDYTNPVKYKTDVWHTVGYDISDTTGPEFDNNAKAEISHSILFRDPYDSPYPCYVSYEMADSKTINCYFTSHIDGGLFRSLKGETLKASDKDLNIYQIDKVLYSSDEKGFSEFTMNYREFNKVISDNIGSLNDDQVIVVHNYSLVIATKKTVNVDYDLTVKLDYKDSIRKFDSAGEKMKGENGTEYTISNIIAGPLSADFNVDFKVSDAKKEYEEFTTLFSYEPAKIKLSSGKIIEAAVSTNHNYEEQHTVTLTYCKDSDNSAKTWLIVDPSEIVSVEFQGKTITR